MYPGTVSVQEPGSSYRCQDAAAPDEWEQVECSQLSRLIELAVFGFGQMQPPVDFLKWRGRKYWIDFIYHMPITQNQPLVDIAE